MVEVDEPEGLRRRHQAPAATAENADRAPQEPVPTSPRAGGGAGARSAPRKSLADLLFAPFETLLGEGTVLDPQSAVVALCEQLRFKYHASCPRFEHSSFRDAVSTARSASKFLLVYLHSDLHDDTDHFCRNVLCSTELCTFLNESDCIVSWAGSVHEDEGFRASLTLGSASFPYVALLTCVGRTLNIIEKMHVNMATITPAQVIRRLNLAIEKNTQVLHTARHIQQQQTEAARLREQQDREYQQSLEADRQREEEARALEEAKRFEEEERARLKAEEEAKQQQFLASLQAKRQRVADEPSKASDGSTTTIRFHLHDGSRLERVFYVSDTLQLVREFIEVTFHDRNIAIRNFELATNFPKRVFGPEETELTLKDAQLTPQALVFVQDLDS